MGCCFLMDRIPQVDWSSSVVKVWYFLLVPWLFVAVGTSMAFEDGPGIGADVFAASVLTFPIAIVLATILRRRNGWLVFLPCINLAAALFT